MKEIRLNVQASLNARHTKSATICCLVLLSILASSRTSSLGADDRKAVSPFLKDLRLEVVEQGNVDSTATQDALGDRFILALSENGVGHHSLSSSDTESNSIFETKYLFRDRGQRSLVVSYRTDLVNRKKPLELFLTLADGKIASVSSRFENLYPTNEVELLYAIGVVFQRNLFGENAWLEGVAPSIQGDMLVYESNNDSISIRCEAKSSEKLVPLKVSFIFGEQSNFGERKLTEIKAGPKDKAVNQIKYSFETVDLDVAEPLFPIRRWRYSEEIQLIDGDSIKLSGMMKLVSAEQTAVSQAKFLNELEIPLGHSVQVEGAPQLPYVWNGDWAVPESELLTSTKFSSVGAIWRTIGLIAFIAIPVFVWSVSRKRGQDRVGKQWDAILKNNRQSERK